MTIKWLGLQLEGCPQALPLKVHPGKHTQAHKYSYAAHPGWLVMEARAPVKSCDTKVWGGREGKGGEPWGPERCQPISKWMGFLVL